MKRTRQHQIDEEAERLFNSLLPSEWVANPYAKGRDYGKDFQVEITEHTELTGVTFVAQVKGAESIQIRDDALAIFDIETKYLKYWCDKVQDPVFLFVFDVGRETGFWIFVQEYIAKRHRGNIWRVKKKLRLFIPTVNKMSDTAKLHSKVMESRAFMAARYPTSIENAIQSQIDAFTARDPRFEVGVSIENNKPQFIFKPKYEGITHQIVLRGDAATITQRMDDLVSRGRPVSFGPGEIEILGTPLADEINRLGGIIQCETKRDVEYKLSTYDADGLPLSSLGPFQAQVRGGMHEVSLHGGPIRSPFSFHIDFLVDGDRWAPLDGVAFNFDGFGWEQQSLLKLAFFELIFDFFNSLLKCAKTDVAISSFGNNLHTGRIAFKKDMVAEICEYMKKIDRARKLASRLNLNPVFRVSSLAANLFELDLIDSLSDGRSDVKLRYPLELSLALYPTSAREIVSAVGLHTVSCPIEHSFGCLGSNIFHNKTVALRLTEAELISPIAEFKKWLENEKSIMPRAIFRSTPDSNLTVELIERLNDAHVSSELAL